VLKGKAFLRQETDFLDAVVTATFREIGRSDVDPKIRMAEIRPAVEREINLPEWRRKFAGDDSSSLDLFDNWSWPTLLEVALAEMWPR